MNEVVQVGDGRDGINASMIKADNQQLFWLLCEKLVRLERDCDRQSSAATHYRRQRDALVIDIESLDVSYTGFANVEQLRKLADTYKGEPRQRSDEVSHQSVLSFIMELTKDEKIATLLVRLGL